MDGTRSLQKGTMSEKLSSLRKRMAKLERNVADIAHREKLVNCNCQELTIAQDHQPEEFEREMNLPCPSHGLRRLGKIIHIVSVSAPSTPGILVTGPLGEIIRQEEPHPDENAFQEVEVNDELDRLLEIYRARIAEDDRLKREKEEQEEANEAEEF